MVIIVDEAEFCFGRVMVEIWDPVDQEEWIDRSFTWVPWSKGLVEQLSILSGIVDLPGQEYTEEEMDICRENDLLEVMDMDIDEPSYFTEWDQSNGVVVWAFNGKKVTPEMIVQHNNLNHLYNSLPPGEPLQAHVELEITEINRNFIGRRRGATGVAKCYLGSVYLSKDIIRSLISLVEERQMEWYDGDTLSVGNRFTAWISYNHPMPMESERIFYKGCSWRMIDRATSSPW